MVQTTRRMSFFMVPAAIALVSFGLTAGAQDKAATEKKAEPKVPSKVDATEKAEKPAPKATKPATKVAPKAATPTATQPITKPATSATKPVAKPVAQTTPSATKPAPSATKPVATAKPTPSATKPVATAKPTPSATKPVVATTKPAVTPTATKPVEVKTATKADEPKAVAAPQPKPVVAAPVPAVKPSPAAIALAKQIRAAKNDFAAADAAAQQKARGKLVAALNKLDARLSADGQNGADWKSFLLFADLQAELNKKSDVDTAKLATIGRRYSAGYVGLEGNDYRNTAIALEEFTAATEVAQNKDLKKSFETTLEELADATETIGDAGPDSTQAAQLGRLVGWLDAHGQSDKIVTAVTTKYSQPNLLFDVTQAFADESLAQPIDRTEPVRDCILGTSISGRGRTVGDVKLDFIPSDDRATIEARMYGINQSRTVGVNRSALIFSTGRTELGGRQLLFVDQDGLTAGHAIATARVNNHIYGFGSTKRGIMGKIVTKIAAKKAPQQQAQGQAIAGAHAKQRLYRQLDSEAKEMVLKANEEFTKRVRLPLKRFNAEPEVFQFTTTDDALRLRVLQATTGKLAAPSAPPKLPSGTGIGLRVHRSLIDNGAQQMLAGRKFDRERIDDLVRKQFGLELKERNEEDEVPFSITFADKDPVTVAFAGDKVSITVRSKGFTSDDKSLEAMEITTHYLVSANEQGLKLTRDGEYEIYPPGFKRGVDKLSFQQTSLRTLLKKKFEKVLPAEFVGEGIVLDEGRGTIYIAHVDADDDWLSLGFKKRAEPVAAE